jgi:hypothetical protein
LNVRHVLSNNMVITSQPITSNKFAP